MVLVCRLFFYSDMMPLIGENVGGPAPKDTDLTDMMMRTIEF